MRRFSNTRRNVRGVQSESRNARANKVQLTESQFNRLVMNCVHRLLREAENPAPVQQDDKAEQYRQAVERRMKRAKNSPFFQEKEGDSPEQRHQKYLDRLAGPDWDWD